MKKQINPTIKAHLIRGAFYLLLLVAVCAIPFALAQRTTKRTTAKPSVVRQGMAANRAAGGPKVLPPATGAVSAALGVQRNTATDQSLLPYDFPPKVPQVGPPRTSSGMTRAHAVSVPPAPKAPQVVLYDQYDNAGPNATLSATFDDIPTGSSDLADDFVVPAGETWNVESIDADGTYFNGVGPAFDWNVFIYTDSGGLPGTQVFSALNQPVTVVGTTFTVTLPSPAVVSAGTYWIEIQANMDFATQGEWGWTDRTVQSNGPAAWQNPGGFFGVCPTWTAKLTCIPTASGPDQVFRLNGTTGGGCVVTGSIDLSDPTQVDRLFRSGIPQTCPASTSCATLGDGLPHHYDEYTFTNTTGATQCVTVDTNTACTGTNFIFTAAYLGSFDPNNICTNWIGDSGFSPNPEQAFSFDLDNGQTVVLVVSEVNPDAGCPSYTVTVSGICGAGTPTPTPTATATATATPTATPTGTPRPTPTPRPRPTPHPRPTP